MAIANDLWGEELPVAKDVDNPNRILREQAHSLTTRTQGRLVGLVVSEGIDYFPGPDADAVEANQIEGAAHYVVDRLTIGVPNLGFFRVAVVATRYKPTAPSAYPLFLYDLIKDPATPINCANETEFTSRLADVLQSDHVRKVMSNLLAFAQE